MIPNHKLTKDERDRLDAFNRSSPEARREIFETYEMIARHVEDENIIESVDKLLKFMMRIPVKLTTCSA